MSSESELIRDRARRYVEEVLSFENVDAIEEIAAPPREWADNVSTRDGTRIETYEDAKRWLTRTFSKIDEWSLTVGSVIVDGDEATVIWRGTGRIEEEWFGVPATASPFETTGVSYLGFEDGRIVEIHEVWDSMDFLPEVAKVARRGVVKEMRDGIVVIDEAGQIVDVNPATIETFDRGRDDLLGEPIAALLGESTAPPEPGETVVVTGPDGRRHFEVGASPLTDLEDERIGRTLVFREITERRRRVQQLEVLNRVLRHNLRNDLTVIEGFLETATERADEPVADHLSQARDTARELRRTAETAGTVRAALAATEVERQSLETVVESIVARARSAYPDATIEASVDDAPTVEATSALADGLWELLENACEYAGEAPSIEVGVARRDGRAVVRVADDGPGIPEHELRVLDAGRETDLEHGSGLGLWLAYWVVEAAGGDLSFETRDGTTVRATLPLAPELADD